MTSPQDPHANFYTHVNGSLQEQLDRFAVTELCKGWPVYRDASEWQNYRSLFAEEAYVWTTWSGPQTIDSFIQISQQGKTNGVFIMHRECGTLAALGRPATGRALGKMKATITHRFADAASPNTWYDVDCDCRFIFFCERVPVVSPSSSSVGGGVVIGTEWKAKYVKLFYEKDKVVPVDGHSAPRFEQHELERYPEGYRYLGAAQARLGYAIDVHLPTARNELWGRMYGEMEKWLEGEQVDLFWEPRGEYGAQAAENLVAKGQENGDGREPKVDGKSDHAAVHDLKGEKACC